MKKLFSLIVLLPVLALGQGLSSSLPWAGGGKVLASFPLTTSGALIAEDANTVAHVYWNGTALVDTKGNLWAMNGTVPQVTANPFTTTRYGAGPFSAANYYSLGTGTDVLDFAGDFTICVVVADIIPGYQAIASNGHNGADGAGWFLGSHAAIGFYFNTTGPASALAQAVSGALAISAGPIVVCAGRIGTNVKIKVNAGTTVTAGSAPVVPSTADTAFIGQSTPGGSSSGTIYEVYATSSPWNEATVTAIQQKVLGHFDGSSALSVTRTTNATYENPAGTVWTAAPGVARITSDGLLVEPARTNYALQSNTISTAAALTTGWDNYLNGAGTGGSVSTVAGAPVTGTWAEITSSANNGTAFQATTTPSGTSFAACAWVAKASGTSIGGVQVRGGANRTACTCSRSDAGSCTAAAYSTTGCTATATIGTTPIRLCAYMTGDATTTPGIALSPGDYTVATGTTRFSGAQVEVGTYPTSLIVTTTTAVARNADQVSATVPAVPSKWCIATTGKLERTPVDDLLWSLDAHTGADTSYSSTKIFRVNDSTPALKTFTATADATIGSHRYVACDTSGVLTLALDGTLRAGTGAGAGTGILTTPKTTLNFGQSSGTLFHFGGYLKNIKICGNAKSAKDCK